MRLSAAMSSAALLLALNACNSSNQQISRASSDESKSQPAYVRIPLADLSQEFIARTGFNRDHKRDDVFAFGYIDRSALNNLNEDVAADVVELDAWEWASNNFDAKTLAPLTEPFGTESFEDYHNYEALTVELQGLADTYPNLVKLESAGKSVQGRELWLVKISDNPEQDEAEPKLLYIANMHGDEVVGRELMIYLSRRLVNEYESSDRIRNLVNNAQIYIMPSMNPDGFERRSRFNANNSDLNRDFPDFTSDPRDIPTNREQETKLVMDLHSRHHFAHAVNFHGGDVCFNMPWDTKPNSRVADRFGDDSLMVALARRYADANPTMTANSGGSFDKGITYGYEWYEVDGGLQDWSNYYRRSFHATVELSYTKWPGASQLPVAWNENKESVLRYLEDGIFGIHLNVIDSQGLPVEGATVGIASAARSLTYDTSVIHRATMEGTQTVRVSKSGYESVDINVEPSSFDGTLTDVVLPQTLQ